MDGRGSLKNFILKNYLLVIIIPAFIIMTITSSILIKHFRTDIIDKSQVNAENVGKNINLSLNHSLNVLKYTDSIIENNNNVNSTLKSIVSSNKNFNKIEVVNYKGIITNSYPKQDSRIGSNISAEGFYKSAIEKKIYWTGTSDPMISCSYPGKNFIIIGYFNLSEFYVIKGNLDASIIDKAGIYIYNKNNNLINKPSNIKLNNNSIIYKDENNKKILSSSSVIDVTGWNVIVNQPYVLNTNHLLILILSIMSAVILLAAAMTYYLFFRILLIEKSFNKLSSQTSLVTKGKYENEIVMDSFNEFNYLADNINKMIGNIKERDKKLKEMAYYDYLTGLPNKTYLIQQMENYIKNSKVTGKSFGLIYIDIDDFRKINDTYGHKAGDQVLIQFSKRLNFQDNSKIISSRLGGDEFAVVILNVEGRIELESEVKSIIIKFANPFKYDEKEIYFSISVGVTIYPKDASNYNELLQYADTAMYAAKEQGKNNYKFFTGKMREQVKKKLDIERNLRIALSKNEFILYYQPQIDIYNNTIKGFEALIRWNNREMGFLNPTEFIGISEETNMIIPISNWIIEEACNAIAKVNKKNNKNYTISINISPIQLKYANFISELKEIINRLGINPQLIELEITENVLINSYNEILDILYRIKEIGVKISLDDFGTGYSSFSYLKSLPIDFLKIDKTFVNNIEKDNKELKLIKSIIFMAHDLNMKVIAEGIETSAQLYYMKNNGCDIVQGFVYSRPIPEDLLNDYIENYNKEEISSDLVNIN